MCPEPNVTLSIPLFLLTNGSKTQYSILGYIKQSKEVKPFQKLEPTNIWFGIFVW